MKHYPRLDLAKLERLPAELKALTQWVCWVLREDPSRPKPAKLLIDPKSKPARSGRDASHSDLNTWASFAEASEFFASHKKLAYQGKEVPVCGLGFVFSPQDPYTGIDIDDCRDPKTGEVLAEAEVIIKTLDSYTELSPSETGVHIIINATLPSGSGRRRNRVEMYSHSRYFTITGAHLTGTPRTVEARQEQLQSVYSVIFGSEPPPPERPLIEEDPKLIRVRSISDDDLLLKAFNAANGAKFRDLWESNGVTDHSQADAALCSILAYWTRMDADRIDRLFRRSALMRAKWDQRRGRDTYGNNTITFACRGATALYDPDLDATVAETHNDIANAEILVQLQGDQFVWCKEWESWLTWNCHHWQPDADLELLHAAESVSKELLRRVLARPDADAKTQAKKIKWAITTGDDRRVNSIDKFSRRRMYCSAHELNVDAYLLCCQNGVLDLRSGELRDGMRADRITRTTAYPYMKSALCPVWDRFLNDIMQSDEEMIHYLWRVLGYSLTGDITERAFFLFHGEGRNGKSTFVETLKALLGPPGQGYAQKARFSTFLQKSFQGGANDDVAHLAGARVVVASEADERHALDVSLVKELTGGDSHRARHLYGREFEFNPQFKLFLVTNKIPPIYETTYAVWDRLHYVPFEWRVPDGQVDRTLGLRILGELPGILAKAVQACIEWQQEGLQPPEKVLRAGKQLYKEMDMFGQYLSECCDTVDIEAKETHKNIYKNYCEWAKEQGFRKPLSSKMLGSYLREKDFPESRETDNVKFWGGIRLKVIRS